MLQEQVSPSHAQRIQVEIERHHTGDQAVIHVESHDDGLGWYTAGALKLPLQQLPLLEQAIQEMRARAQSEEYGKIIPFPLPAAETA